MSAKQDGTSPRTAVDLERKYSFGQTFAEVYNLVSDARKVAEEAQAAVDGLDQEAIFNLLTNFGQAEGVYRDENGDVYVNASYIKSGKLAAEYIDGDNLKVSSANIVGKLVATQIDTQNLKVLAANITGTLQAGQIDTTNLTVSAANITGNLKASQIDTTNLSVNAANITGTLTIGQLPTTVAETSDIPTESDIVSIVDGTVTADYVNALEVKAYELVSEGSKEYRTITIKNGKIDFYSGYIRDEDYGLLEIASGDLDLATQGGTDRGGTFRFYLPNGSYWELDGSGMYYYDSNDDYVNGFVLAD